MHTDPPRPDDRVLIFDTTLRDGEQSPGISLNTTEKLEIAHQLARLGVDVIEAGFPIASPGDFEAVQAIAREVEGPIMPAWPARTPATSTAPGRPCATPRDPRIHTFVSTSDIHIEHQLQSTREDVKGLARASVAQARALCDDVEFSPMDATRADVEFTAEVVQIAIDEGATTINIPDTVGYAMPQEYAAFLTRLYELVPGLRDVTLSVHCHDDLGLAVANSFAGVLAGARQVECAINGLGERAGNASLEEIVMLLHTRQADIGLPTGVNTTRDRPHEPPREPPDRLRRAAQQGDRRAQRVRARVGHPPGRRPEGAHDLRDHGRARPSAWTPTSSSWASTPAATRCSRRCEELGYPLDRPGPEHRLQALQGDRGQEEAGHRDGPRGAGHRRAARGDARLLAGVVRRRGLLAPPAARHRGPEDARTARTCRARSPATARSTRSSARSTPPAASTRSCASSASTRSRGGQDALGEVSVVVELGRPGGASASGCPACSLRERATGAGQAVATDIIEAAGIAYVRALTNAVHRVAGRSPPRRSVEPEPVATP